MRPVLLRSYRRGLHLRTCASPLLALVVLGLALSGCSGGREDLFAYREPVRIDPTTLRLDGYYARALEDSAGHAVRRPLLLWADGTAAYFRTYTGASPEKAHAAFLAALEPLDRQRSEQAEAHWGGFRLRGDSIFIQILFPHYRTPGGDFLYDPVAFDGLVLDDTTFVLTGSVLMREGRSTPRSWRYHFYALQEKPDSANWTRTRVLDA